jgi:hypothetical protein
MGTTITLETPKNPKRRNRFRGYYKFREQVRLGTDLVKAVRRFEDEQEVVRSVIIWHFRNSLTVSDIVSRIKDRFKAEMWMSEASVRNVLKDAKKVR